MVTEETELLIAGGGPAGMMAGLLFARAGVKTLVLEKHGDFLRDFRGDTVHPSTLRLFHELGLLERFLERPHDQVRGVTAFIGGQSFRPVDLSRFDPRWSFIAMMPQWEFLDFVRDEASLYRTFSLEMNAEAVDLIEDGGRVIGVRCRSGGVEREIRARLVIGADGRDSRLREAAGLPLESIGAPIDIFWFSLPKAKTEDNRTTAYFTRGRIMVVLDRGDYWQCAYVFAKGEADRLRARGLDAFRKEVSLVAPAAAEAADTILDWDQVKLLSVTLDRLEQWDRPGFLAIGDAAHAMSPIGGVGINVAIQDAVAAANILAAPLAGGEAIDRRLPRVRQRRITAVKLTQAFQNLVQKRVIQPLLELKDDNVPVPLPVRLLDRFPLLRTLPALFIGFGWRPEHIRSPDAGLRRTESLPPSPSRD